VVGRVNGGAGGANVERRLEQAAAMVSNIIHVRIVVCAGSRWFSIAGGGRGVQRSSGSSIGPDHGDTPIGSHSQLSNAVETSHRDFTSRLDISMGDARRLARSWQT